MSLKYPELFKPYKIGKTEIKNRIAMCPMLTTGYFDEYGVIKDEVIDFYEERAKGGVGLVFTFGVIPNSGLEKSTAVLSPFATPNIFIPQMQKLADRLHQYGTKLFVQVWFGIGRAIFPAALLEGPPIAPSVCNNRWDPSVECREITKEEIETLIQSTVEAAVMCKQAGCDGIDINGAYGGYIGDQFTFDAFNQRTDEYGGSIDGKIRLHTEVIKRIKAACGNDFPVTLRFGIKHYAKGEGQGAISGEKYKEFGRDIEESIEMAKKLEEAGYDGFLVGNGCFDSVYWQYPPMYQKDGLWLEDSKKLKAAVKVPVICPGKINLPEMAEEAIKNNMTDAIGLGRALLADPDWANKARAGLDEDIRPCISCNNGCVGNANLGRPIQCAVNANLFSSSLTPAQANKKICVIGGGVAGMETARVAALRGHDVTIYEQDSRLGGALIAAAVPEYKEADRRLLDWYILQLHKAGVKISLNTEMTLELLQTLEADDIIVGTGTSERSLPIPGVDQEHVASAIEVLLGTKTTGQHVVIIGGGQVGCEVALWLKEQGKEVTVVEVQNSLLAGGAEPVPAANKLMLQDLLTYHDIKTYLSSRVSFIDRESVTIETPEGKTVLPAESVIMSIGYNANDALYREVSASIPKNVWLVGDAKLPSNILYAVKDGNAIGKIL
ncbi:2-enoate reductase FldZ [compost metagenome]